MSRTVSASAFKARCLALMDDVERTGEEIVITKRGRPVARLAPVVEPPPLEGSVRQLVDDDELLAPIPGEWGEAP